MTSLCRANKWRRRGSLLVRGWGIQEAALQRTVAAQAAASCGSVPPHCAEGSPQLMALARWPCCGPCGTQALRLFLSLDEVLCRPGHSARAESLHQPLMQAANSAGAAAAVLEGVVGHQVAHRWGRRPLARESCDREYSGMEYSWASLRPSLATLQGMSRCLSSCGQVLTSCSRPAPLWA